MDKTTFMISFPTLILDLATVTATTDPSHSSEHKFLTRFIPAPDLLTQYRIIGVSIGFVIAALVIGAIVLGCSCCTKKRKKPMYQPRGAYEMDNGEWGR